VKADSASHTISGNCINRPFDELADLTVDNEAGLNKVGVVMKKRAIAVAAIAVVAMFVLAVFRARSSRELILEADGLPLADLKGDILPNVAGCPLVPTSTDSDGRLDLQRVPRGTDYFNVELRDGAGRIRLPNTLMELPTGGFRKVVDFQNGRTISNSTTVYADFVLFTFKVRRVVTWDQRTIPDPTLINENVGQVRLSDDAKPHPK
jgi:hypothetical protein